MIGDALNILHHAQAEYRRALRAVDGKLQAAVAQDPGALDAARAAQALYAMVGYEPVALAALEQPPSVDTVAWTVVEPVPFSYTMVNAKPTIENNTVEGPVSFSLGSVGDGGEPIVDTPVAPEESE